MEIAKERDISSPKQKLRGAVAAYKEVFPDEYVALCQIVREKRNNLKSKSGAIDINPLKQSADVMERLLFEISETLQAIIFRHLDPIEFAWFTSKEGGRWFAKAFKEFSIGQ